MTLLIGSSVLTAAPVLARVAFRAQPDRFAAVYSGAWHLGFAQGRATCAPHDQPLTTELRALTLRDLEEVRRGVDALAACREHARDGARSRAPLRLPDAAALVGPGDVDTWLERLRPEYLTLARASPCGGDPIVGLGTLCTAGHRFGSAAARVQCAISTWNGPLADAVARAVRADLAAARQTLAGLDGSRARSEGLAALDRLIRRLDEAHGEEIYETLVRLSEAIQSSFLRSSKTY